jgi:predicted nucleic acid-binding protein
MKSFIDSNVLIYWTDDSTRADVVEQLLASDACISIQVLNEFTNVLFKKRALSIKQIQKWCDTLLEVCEVHELSVKTHSLALLLMAKYKLSFYDANIVSAAGLAGCDVLYSEDMQDGLTVRFPDKTTLSIRNPFR